MGAEWDGLARVKRADRRRAWLRTPSLPFCFAAPYRAWGAGFARVRGSPGCGLAVGGCSLPVAREGVSCSCHLGPFAFLLAFRAIAQQDFALGNTSIKPQALHGHGPRLHSFHGPKSIQLQILGWQGAERGGFQRGATQSSWGLRFWGGKGLQ